MEHLKPSTMSDSMSSRRNPSLEDLLNFSKIVSSPSCANGYVVPLRENLKAILAALDPSKFPGNLPVAIVAVIGPKGSGKSFVTNFLIQYLRAEGEGGWMSKIAKKTEKGEPMGKGFSWASVTNQAFFKPDEVSSANSGVYLWPEPFLMTKGANQKIVVWIMHVHAVEDKEDVEELEKFLAITCSRIMEIKWNSDEFRILEHYRHISTQSKSVSPTSITNEEICKSVVYVIRSAETTATAGTDAEAKKALEKLMTDAQKDASSYQKILDNFQHVNLVWMKNCSEPLHDDVGILNKGMMKTLNKMMKKVVEETMLEESEIVQKQFGKGQGLTLGNMYDFLMSAVKKTFSKKLGEPARGGSQSLPKIRDKGVDNAINLTSHHIIDMSLSEHVDQLKSDLGGGAKTNVNKFMDDKTDELYDTLTKTAKLAINESDAPEEPGTHKAIEQSKGGRGKHFLRSPPRNVRESFSTSISGRGWARGRSIDTSHDYKHLQAGSTYQSTMGFPLTTRVSTMLVPSGFVDMDIDIPKDKVIGETCGTPQITSHSLSSEQREIGNALVKSIVPPHSQVEFEAMEVDNNEKTEKAGLKLQEEAEVERRNVKLLEENRESEVATQNLKLNEETETRRKLEEIRKAETTAVEKVKIERIKKEEEEERKIKEKARLDMEDCANIAICQIKQRLPLAIDEWIRTNLNLSTANQNMDFIYGNLIKEVVVEHKEAVNWTLKNEFVRRVDKHCKDECLQILRNIDDHVISVNAALKRQFSLHGYLVPSKLEQFAADELQRTKISGEGYARDKVKLAILKLLGIYNEHNIKIIEAEKQIYEMAKCGVLNVYNDEMKRYLKDAPYSPQKLYGIHSKLVEKLVDAFGKACHISISVDQLATEETNNLKGAMDREFTHHKQSNDIKLSRCQVEARKVIEKLKTQYNDKIEEVLKRNADGLEVKVLGKQNTAIVEEVMKLLEMEIRSKVRPEEPLESHRKALQAHFDNYWPSVLEANRKSLKKKEMEVREKKKTEGQRQLQEEEQEASKRKSLGTFKDHSNAYSSKFHAKLGAQAHEDSKSEKSEDNREVLPPLIFHLQSSRITMAMGVEGKADILKNEHGDEQTPAFVVFTPENGFIYGTAALAHVDSTSVETGMGGFNWSIADLFIAEDLSWEQVEQIISINKEFYVICSEFLLALLLRKLKLTVEGQMKGRCDRAIIAVPFWLSSPQRIQIKDGAEIAGFSEVYLINEASAAAYNFLLTDKCKDRPGEIIVVSESLDRVDAFVFTYLSYTRKLEMIAHSSNYEDENGKKKAGAGYLKTFVKGVSSLFTYAYNYFISQDTDHKDYDHTVRTVRDACKAAINQAHLRNRHRPTEYLFVCENFDKWGSILNSVARDFGTRACEIKSNRAVVNGCAVFTQDLKSIGILIKDKLAYDVFRLDYGKNSRKVSKAVPKKDNMLPDNVKVHHSQLSTGVHETRFFQSVMEAEHLIGELSLPQGISSSQAIEPRIEITNEAVVKLLNVMVHTSTFFGYREKTEYVDKARFKWTTLNLSDERRRELSALLDHFVPPVPKEDPVLMYGRAELLRKCSDITEKINTGQFNIKSDFIKGEVFRMISEARRFAEHERSSIEGVQNQMKTLQKLYDKYNKNNS